MEAIKNIVYLLIVLMILIVVLCNIAYRFPKILKVSCVIGAIFSLFSLLFGVFFLLQPLFVDVENMAFNVIFGGFISIFFTRLFIKNVKDYGVSDEQIKDEIKKSGFLFKL